MSRLPFVALLAALVLAGVAPSLSLGQSIPLTLPDDAVTEGDPVSVPISVGADLAGEGVLAFQIALSFDGFRLQVDRLETAGTLSDAFGSVEYSVENPGTSRAVLRIAAAGTTPLAGIGSLVSVVFTTGEPGAAGLSFDAPRTFFNEGSPALDATDTGTITIAPLPVVGVSPDRADVLRGEPLAFSASGGAEPYTWSITDATAASIDPATGVLTGLAPGTTQVIAADANGVRDTTGVIRILGFELSLPDTTSLPGRTLDLPVLTSDLSGLAVTAGQFRIRGFDGADFALDGIQTSGTLLDGASITTATDRQNLVTVAFASAVTLSGGADTLMVLRARLSDDAGGRTYGLSVEDVLFNESLPGQDGGGGRVQVDAFPTLRISPGGGSLLAGSAVDLTVSNATEPVTWTVSDPARAAISPTGRLTALQGGSVTVTATDALGATVTSSLFSIADVTVAVADTSVRPNATIRLPIRIGNLPAATGPRALEMRIEYPANLYTVTGIDATGTRSEGWAYSVNTSGSALTVAGAGTQPVEDDGVLLTLIAETGSATGAGTVRITDVTLNEGDPVAQVRTSTRVTVTDANRAPDLVAVPTTVLTTGAAYAAQVQAADPDGDAVTINGLSSPSWLTVTDNGDGTADLRGTAPADGFYPLTLRVSDGTLSTDRALTLRAYTALTTVPLPAGSPGPTVTQPTFEVQFDPLSRSATLQIAVQTGPDETTLSLPNGEGLAVRGLWTLDLDGVSTFSTDVCFVVDSRVNNVDLSKVTVRSRETPSEAWGAPLTTEVRTSGSGDLLLCAVDVRTFSDFVLTAPAADLPVEMSHFRAQRNGRDVELAWGTASETANAGFRVERAVDGAAYQGLGFVRGVGTTDAPQAYRFVDRTVPFGATEAAYRLRQIDLDGTEHVSDPVRVMLGAPDALALHTPVPHPVRADAVVRYAVPEGGPVRLDVYNILGQRVATLLDRALPAGENELAFRTAGWSSGVYFLRLTAGGHVRIQRLTVVR